MISKTKLTIAFTALAALTVSCTSRDSIKKILKDNPDILAEAIEANPEKVMMAINNAAMKAREQMQKKQADDEAKSLEESFEKPLEPAIDTNLVVGPKDAPLTLVIYSDFECPYCGRGFANENKLKEKYQGKIRVLFKNLPLPMHPNAMIAAQYFEAVRMQSVPMAEKFHEAIFKNQRKLQEGESFLKSAAKGVGADMSKLAKDIKSETVKSRIAADMEEANKFGFQGTPGYLLNGIPVKGAYPTEHFIEIVEKLKEKGKVTL